ncbi:MAG: hypothetical protein DRN37_03925 [Thermoplasmata archaeon]|nr:MAG: hypothetical protein DRN37_03925 [Thermoplasmata archaeon]
MTAGFSKRIVITSVLAAAAMVVFTGTSPAHAGVELTPLMQSHLGVKPLDAAISPDGKLVFLLAHEEIVVYSVPGKKITNRIPLTGNFDRVTYSREANLLILTSSTAGILKTVKVETVFPIDISGHPFKGPADAPVTIAVFDDYQ